MPYERTRGGGGRAGGRRAVSYTHLDVYKRQHHTRQSAFEGSRRQKRAELVRIVLAAPGIAAPELAGRLDAFEQAAGRPCVDADVFDGIVADLVSEGFFRREGDLFFA